MKCKNCGGTFKKAVSHQKFCCDRCRSIYWFSHNRKRWNNYMKEWSRNNRTKRFANTLRDFKPEKRDFSDLNNF